MPYALFPPQRIHTNLRGGRTLQPTKPKYTTNDRTIAQVLYANNWVVLSVPDPGSVNSTTSFSGVTELHYTGIELHPRVFEGPQVEDSKKNIVLWWCSWSRAKEMDLRYAINED